MLAFRRLAARLVWMVPFAALVSTACEHNPAGPVALASITVAPTPVTLATGATQQYTATGVDVYGNAASITPNWSVVAGGGTINSSSGLFTAGTAAGTYANTVTASVGSIVGSASVTVTPGALALMTVTPNPKDLAIGGGQTFSAAGKDANGNAVSVSPTWSVVAGGGTFAPGTANFTAGTVPGTFANTVKATSGSVSGFATVTVNSGALFKITVTPDPVSVATSASAQFTATGLDLNNNVIPISPTWSTTVTGGTITSSGRLTAGVTAPETKEVRATVNLISGFAVVNVITPGALASITVTPNPGNVAAGGTLQFTAVGRDAANVILAITPTWSTTVPGGSINTGSGLLTAGTTTGTYIDAVQATSGGVSGFATVNVNPAPPVGPSLGAAETHGLLAGSAFTCAGAPGTINADASVWPGSAFTGFPPCVITGATHAADAFAQTAQGDLTTAFLALAAMPCGTTITSDLGGTTLAEGVYCSGSSVGVTGPVTLTGNANSLFVIRAASTLTTAGSVVMAGGAQAKNVYWWVGSSATLGTNSAWQGNILALTSITLVNNVTLCGRALARNGAVNLGTGDNIKLPPAAAATCVFP